MNALLNQVLFGVYDPAAIVNNASLTQNVIDTYGFADLLIVARVGATDFATAAAKLTESDVKASATSLTGPADIVGSRFGTDANDTGSTSTLPSATDDNKFFVWKVDLRGRKRYILPVITVGAGAAGAFWSVIAILSRAQDAPRLATEAGAAQRLVI